MAQSADVTRDARVVFPAALHQRLIGHLLRGDGREHGAVVAAGLAPTQSGPRLLVREVWPAQEPADYRLGAQGYMGLQATFIHRCITQCRDRRLVHLAAHNHAGAGHVAFSAVDMASHARGYRALLDIAEGMPVGALVLAKDAIELDLWHPGGTRSSLRSAIVLGPWTDRYYPDRRVRAEQEHAITGADDFSRQVLFLGDRGQALFQRAKVAIVGLGGVGSLVSEYLARLGVGSLVLIDPDRLEPSNISRVVGAERKDIGEPKVDVAARVARCAQSAINVEVVEGDFARGSVASRVLDCDFIVLAADTMRARLVFNAIVHQFYIPGVQLGTKIVVDQASGDVTSAFSVVRQVNPGEGCLMCNQLIDPSVLAEEWKSDAERAEQQYGTTIANPSVITMNAVTAAHAMNDFLFSFVGFPRKVPTLYRRYDHLTNQVVHEHPRRDVSCLECSQSIDSRLGYGMARDLPCSL